MQNLIKSSVILWLLFVIFILLTMLLPNAKAEEKKVIDKNFIAVSSYLVAMTVFDIESTYAVIRNGGHERNPIMKPFIKSGRLATYGVQLGVDAAFIWLAYEMKGSKHKEFRKIWWVAPMVLGTEHGVLGGLNFRYMW